MERPKIDLELNKQYSITLLFDNCIEGTGNYGKYFLYAISNGDGKEYSLFAPETLHQQLKNYKKGDALLVTKQAIQKNSKVVINYDVHKVPTSEEPTQHNPPKQEDDFYYTAMEQSFDDAFKIQQKFNGVTNISQVAITLFIQRTKGNHTILNY